MQQSNRREFLKSSAVVAGASTLAAPAIANSKASANDRVRVAVVGLGGRGRRSHCGALRQMADANVQIAALSDCDEKRMNATADEQEKFSGTRPKLAVDMRKLLDDPSIDAVSIATPDHWHALQMIWACQAGKDVYCEKPGSHNLFEGRKMVEAARKYERIVQHGTQCRSSPNIREGIGKLHEGVIGRVYMARAMAYKLRSGGKNEIGPVPPGLDWDLWLGPAPEKPYNRLAIYRWRFLKDYGSGQTGDQGVHELDILRWGLGINTHPTSVQAIGVVNLFHPTSDEDTFTNLAFACRYDEGDVFVSFETRDGYTNDEAGMGTKYPFVDHQSVVGVIFFGTEGYMIFPDYSSYHTFLGPKREPGPSASVEGQPMMDLDHFQNWIAAVRSRKPQDLHAEIEQGHLSSSICHLANAAATLGRGLRFDPEKERFVDDEQANRLVKPPYRAPYVVPDEV
ncbi:MAG TPA: Gfo/Idh/MocA family oxidoreductase [Thermoguttaceae bacterium]|nr:Gfo/Idh/MocA family oxidoreductase [Thermoguttaceae bacterium]